MLETSKFNSRSQIVFSSEGFPGSLQYLHRCKSLKELESQFKNYYVTDEFDHTFFYQEDSTIFHLRFKNNAGEFSLCGSGAFALATSIETKLHSPVTFKSRDNALQVKPSSQGIVIGFDIQKTTELTSFEGHPLFYNQNTGVYFLRVNRPEKVLDNKLIQKFISSSEYVNKHGFCIFYCDTNRPQGELRYFSPWHGREEDSVTGSIHHTLSPLANELTGVSDRQWIQRSNSPGIINTLVKGKTVWLRSN